MSADRKYGLAIRWNTSRQVNVPDSPFWSQPHLRRALARLDFDHVGLSDFMVTDLLESTVLLLNPSPTKNHWVTLALVGIHSERDAIGANIELQAGRQSWMAWVAAGDGSLGKNESAIHIGIGTETKIDQLSVTWPTGTTQVLHTIPVDESILLVENDPDTFVLTSR